MLLKKNINNSKRGNESRRVREQGESTLENIEENDLDLSSDEKKKKNVIKRQISSDKNNNMNSSVDIEKLKIKKKKGTKKKKSKNNKKLNEMDNALLQLEQKNKEKLINGELYDLLEEIEDENKDFKKNVFFSNFHELNNNLGIFDDINEDNKNIINNNYVGVKGDITSHGLIDKYTEKAEDLKKNKKKKKK